MKLKNEFEPIREWAQERGIYDKGNVNSQFDKLIEEVEELRQGIIKVDLIETTDAIGDCVVVLTNLAHLIGIDIEFCINSAYKEIKNRKGKMQNGTFIKE